MFYQYAKIEDLSRRHTKILFTDIVRHTSFMVSEEDRAFDTLRRKGENHSKFTEQFNTFLKKK